MANISEPEELARHLLAKNLGKSTFLIGIDGKDGIGKSTLAQELSRLINAKLISLDDYLIRNQDKYVDSLKIDEIIDAIKSTTDIIIIEGVCLLAAIDRIGARLNDLVYVKRTSHGIWVDEDTCGSAKTADEVIADEERMLSMFLKGDSSLEEKDLTTNTDMKLSALREEIIRYHAKYKPSERASVLFEAKHA
jgi:ABC-type dipeptide/oligopeptide/nickel transport system ATPase component